MYTIEPSNQNHEWHEPWSLSSSVLFPSSHKADLSVCAYIVYALQVMHALCVYVIKWMFWELQRATTLNGHHRDNMGHHQPAQHSDGGVKVTAYVCGCVFVTGRKLADSVPQLDVSVCVVGGWWWWPFRPVMVVIDDALLCSVKSGLIVYCNTIISHDLTQLVGIDEDCCFNRSCKVWKYICFNPIVYIHTFPNSIF